VKGVPVSRSTMWGTSEQAPGEKKSFMVVLGLKDQASASYW
jgi:hypothetical protein